MRLADLPFRRSWWMCGLPGHRACKATYCPTDFDALPPVGTSQHDGSLRWLPSLDPWIADALGEMRLPDDDRSEARQNLPRIQAHAAQLSLVLPTAFDRFLASPDLQRRVPSATACYIDLPERILPSPFGDGGYLLRFLNDQQWVLLWYLYLAPDGGHAILVSPRLLGEDDGDETDPNDPEQRVDALLRDTYVCAPDFETFLHRFWLENRIWYALARRSELDPEQQDYLRHYRV
jgi:hypothetical protein